MKSPSAVAPRAFGERVKFAVPAIAASTVPPTLGVALMLAFLRSTIAAAVVLAVLAPTAARAQTTFTSFDAFLAMVGTSGVDTYDDLTAFSIFDSPTSRQAGSFGYTVSADAPLEDLFFGLENPDVANDIWLSTEDALATIRFDGFGPQVRAVGGRFFATEIDGDVSGTNLFFFAEDMFGISVTRTLTAATADQFFGVVFNNPLVSLRIVTENDPAFLEAYFATVNDLVLAEGRTSVAVPEPATLLLVAAPMLLLAVRRKRRGA